jgi:hypothetical protein
VNLNPACEAFGFGQAPAAPPGAYELPTIEADVKKLFGGGPLVLMLALMFAGGIFAKKKKRFTLAKKRGKWKFS